MLINRFRVGSGCRNRWNAPLRFALLKHDVAVAVAVLHELSRRTKDRLTLFVIMPLLALIARAWFAPLAEEMRELVAFGAASLLTALLAQALIERLWFHRTDGILARCAQRPREGIDYFVPLMLAGIIMELATLAVLDLVDLRGTILGMCAGLSAGLLLPFVLKHSRRSWYLFTTRRLRPFAGARFSTAKAAVLSLGAAASIIIAPSANHLDIIVMGAYLLIVILLAGTVNAEVVRYMTLVGHTGPTLLRHWLPIQLALLWPLTFLLLVAQSWVPASVAALAALMLPVATAMRIFAYRAFSRLIADWIVAVVFVIAAYAAYTVPPLGPMIIVAAIVWLVRRGAGTRWLLA